MNRAMLPPTAARGSSAVDPEDPDAPLGKIAFFPRLSFAVSNQFPRVVDDPRRSSGSARWRRRRNPWTFERRRTSAGSVVGTDIAVFRSGFCVLRSGKLRSPFCVLRSRFGGYAAVLRSRFSVRGSSDCRAFELRTANGERRTKNAERTSEERRT